MRDDLGPFSGLPSIFTGAFGEPAEYRRETGPALAVCAIFLKPFQMTDFDDVSVEGYGPEVHVRAEEVEGPCAGDTITIRGASFAVVGVEPDGKGMIRLRLREI